MKISPNRQFRLSARYFLRKVQERGILGSAFIVWQIIIPHPLRLRFKVLLLSLLNLPKICKCNILTKKIYNNKYEGLKIGLLNNMAIGPFAMMADFYLKMFKIYNYDLKNDVVLITTSKTCNLQLQRMIERVVSVEIDDELYEYINAGGYLYLRKHKKYLSFDHGDWKTIYGGFYYDCISDIDFTQEEIEYGTMLLRKLGINENDTFVTVHNRDNYYWQEKKGMSKPFFEVRNSDFTSLIKSIEYLKKQGIKVIRSGHYRDSNNLPYLSLNIFSEKEKDFMDIFIQRYCLFSITGDSGIADIPNIFKRPVLIHNAISLAKIPIMGGGGIFIHKKFKHKTNNKILSVHEILKIKQFDYFFEDGVYFYQNLSADEFVLLEHFTRSDIQLIDNAEDEILNGVKEMLLLVNDELHLTDPEKELQLKFKRLFPVGHPMRHMKGIISPSFLAKYQ